MGKSVTRCGRISDVCDWSNNLNRKESALERKSDKGGVGVFLDMRRIGELSARSPKTKT